MDGCFKLKMIKKWEELMCIEHINFFFGGTEKQRQSENKVTDGGHKLKDVKSAFLSFCKKFEDFRKVRQKSGQI